MTHNLTTGDRVTLVDRHGIDYPTWRDLAYHVLRVESVDRDTAVVVPDRDYLSAAEISREGDR